MRLPSPEAANSEEISLHIVSFILTKTSRHKSDSFIPQIILLIHVLGKSIFCDVN